MLHSSHATRATFAIAALQVALSAVESDTKTEIAIMSLMKMLLLKTDLAISDIALQVGFSSQSHLTQQFKRLTRSIPKQIR